MIDEKMIRVMELHAEVMGNDRLVAQFFDLDSEKMLDKKIAVLTQLKNGVPPVDISDYYSILELYPKDGQLWE